MNDIYEYKKNGNLDTKRFIRLLVGYWAFTKNYDVFLASKFDVEKGKLSSKKRTDGNYSGFIIKMNNLKTSFLFESNSLTGKVFLDECNLFNRSEVGSSFFKDSIGDNIYNLLVFVSLNYIHPDKEFDYTEVNRIFRYLSTRYLGEYRFIIGSGVSNQYGIKDWRALVKLYDEEVKQYFNTNIENILDKSYNTTYGSFQVLKDLNVERYYEILEDVILVGSTKKISNYTTLSGIADVVSSQFNATKSKQIVITLNYDTLLEDKLIELKQETTSKFKGCINLKNEKIVINHIHGIIKKQEESILKKIYRDSIVLSNDEYIKSYRNNGYSYSRLKEQLRKPCFFVGNSITDYEEQKAIKNQFENNIGIFHFALLKFEGEELEFYRMLRMIRLGILPIYFQNYDEIANELKSIATKTRLYYTN